VNDFETVRAYIQRADRTFGGGPGPRAALDRIEAEAEQLRADGLAVERTLDKANGEITRLRAALDSILHELGVPNEDYAAPVANAVNIARAALAKDEK